MLPQSFWHFNHKTPDKSEVGWLCFKLNASGGLILTQALTNNLSGVLWIKAPQNSGDIVFDSPNNFESFLENKSYNDDFKKSFSIDDSYHFYPTEGRMIVFPSHLQHHVQENKSNEDRISVAFNIRLSNEN